jgi:hypothetical protein
MVVPATAMALAASDMNDTAQTTYDNVALLPYFNMAVEEMFQRMQENNIPITNQNSAQITIPAGTTVVSFTTTPPLPTDLIDIEQIWESNDGGGGWSPLHRTYKINPNIATGSGVILFGQFQWMGDRIVVPESNSDIVIQIDYIRRNVTIPILIGTVNDPIDTNALLFLAHKTAALAAALVAQDETRATVLADLAEGAIERELNIPTKGNQQIATRRRPFRAAFKSWGRSW